MFKQKVSVGIKEYTYNKASVFYMVVGGQQMGPPYFSLAEIEAAINAMAARDL